MNLERAKELLGLSEKESLETLKSKFRERFSKASSEDEKKELIMAYRMVSRIIESFRVDLRKAYSEIPFERLKRRFGEDWLSGRYKG